MSDTKMSKRDALRLTELIDKLGTGDLSAQERSDYSSLFALWQSTHRNWSAQSFIAPATRRPGAIIPRRRDPDAG